MALIFSYNYEFLVEDVGSNRAKSPSLLGFFGMPHEPDDAMSDRSTNTHGERGHAQSPITTALEIARDFANLVLGRLPREEYIRTALQDISEVPWTSTMSGTVAWYSTGILLPEPTSARFRRTVAGALGHPAITRCSFKTVCVYPDVIDLENTVSSNRELYLWLSVSWEKSHDWLCPADIEIAERLCDALRTPAQSYYRAMKNKTAPEEVYARLLELMKPEASS